MTNFPVDSQIGLVQGLASAKLRFMWGIVSAFAIVVVGCRSEPSPEPSSELIRESDTPVVAAEKRETSRFVSLRLWKTEELLDRIALGMSVTDLFDVDQGVLSQRSGLHLFSTPHQLTVSTESSDSKGDTVEEHLELFFCRTNEMPPDASDSPNEFKLTAVAKRLSPKSVEDRPPLVYILPEELKGKVCTGCAPIDTASIDPPGE